MKTCSKCKALISKSEFSKNKSKKDGLQAHCKLCRIEYKKQHALNNPRYYADKAKLYRELNLDIITISRKKHYCENRLAVLKRKKQWRENNIDKVKHCNKIWSDNNPERKLASTHKRRALKLNGGGTYHVSDIENLIITQDSKCVYCKTDLIVDSRKNYHIDHIMPLCLGGSNYPENLQLLCAKCNWSKGGKHPEKYKSSIVFNHSDDIK